jgi:Hsp20/alpha crystallin family
MNKFSAVRDECPVGRSARDVLYQGIAAQTFERSFQLADHVEVKGASLENGLLHVDLVREIPEAMKPRSISIVVPVSSWRSSRLRSPPEALAGLGAPRLPGRFNFARTRRATDDHSSLIPGHVAVGEFHTGRDTYLLTAFLFRRARSRISQNSPSRAGTVDLRTLDRPSGTRSVVQALRPEPSVAAYFARALVG